MGPGIDYSNGTANIDHEAGIHYGMVHQNSLDPDAVDYIYQDGTDVGHEQAKAELTSDLAAALREVLNETSLSLEPAARIAKEAAEALVDDIAGDALDNGGESGPYEYEKDGYHLRTTERGDLWVFKSPFYTYARYCSPCVPGAGNLDDAVDKSAWDYTNTAPAEIAEMEEQMAACGVKTYCLGLDWFENGQAPYPIFKVKKSDLTIIEGVVQ